MWQFTEISYICITDRNSAILQSNIKECFSNSLLMRRCELKTKDANFYFGVKSRVMPNKSKVWLCLSKVHQNKAKCNIYTKDVEERDDAQQTWFVRECCYESLIWWKNKGFVLRSQHIFVVQICFKTPGASCTKGTYVQKPVVRPFRHSHSDVQKVTWMWKVSNGRTYISALVSNRLWRTTHSFISISTKSLRK